MKSAVLTPEQWAQLRGIEPSRGEVLYYPCAVALKDGRSFDRVLVVSAAFTSETFPEERWILFADQVSEFRESPYRIPASLAKKAYDFGESGMGYIMFTLVLADGRRLPYARGSGIIDFVNLPEGVTSDDLVDLVPDEGRSEINRRRGDPGVTGSDYYWCPFYKPPGA